MDVKKIKNCKNKLYYYRTKDFASIYINHYFSLESTNENVVKADLLRYYMLKTNKKYKKRKDIGDKERELYNSTVTTSMLFYGKKIILLFRLKTIDSSVIGENIFDDALDFYKEILLNPNFEKGKLNKEIFEQIKNDFINNQKNILRNPEQMCRKLFRKSMFLTEPTNIGNFTDIEQYEKIINEVTEQDIIEFYNKLISSYICSLAFGNLSEDNIKKIENTFKFKLTNFDYIYDYKEKIVDKDIEIISKDTTQSHIYFVYKVKDYKKDNEHFYRVLLNILNSNNSPVYDTYRNKLGIVYSASAGVFFYKDILYIRADIDKKNKEKAIDALNIIFDRLHDKEEMRKQLKYSKEKIKEDFDAAPEKILETFNEIQNHVLRLTLSSKEIIERINKLTVDDIINQIDNLEYKCMYFYKGDKDEA